MKLAHLEMSDKSVVNVKTPAECLEYLKHITIKLISVGMEPPIGVVTHPATRQWPGGPEEVPGSTRQSRVLPGDRSLQSTGIVCCGLYKLNPSQLFSAHSMLFNHQLENSRSLITPLELRLRANLSTIRPEWPSTRFTTPMHNRLLKYPTLRIESGDFPRFRQ